MNNYCRQIIQELEEEIYWLTEKKDDQITWCEKAIDLILEKISGLKKVVLSKGFKNMKDEIHFFKTLKPQLVSKLIYYNAIYKIEMKRPHGGSKTVRKYLNKELDKLNSYFNNNLDFYKYYRTKSDVLDNKYFVRHNHDVKLSLDTYYFECDHSFSTSHDYKVAKIIGNDLILLYLEEQLLNIRKDNKLNPMTLTWTDNKVSLIELIYALYFIGVFNNGNADIKLIAKCLEKMFNVELGNFYHTFLELRNRKVNRTKFLDLLKENLLRKMDGGYHN